MGGGLADWLFLTYYSHTLFAFGFVCSRPLTLPLLCPLPALFITQPDTDSFLFLLFIFTISPMHDSYRALERAFVAVDIP